MSAPSEPAARSPIPKVPSRRGPRGYLLLGALIFVLALGIVWVAAYGSAEFAYRLGFVEAQDAVVTTRDFNPGMGGTSTKCNRVHLEFAWEGGSGYYTACSNEPSLFYLTVGDRLELAAVPWSPLVFPLTSRGTPLVTTPLLLIAPALALWWVGRRTVSMIGLMRGGATARPMSGSLQAAGGRDTATIILGPADGEKAGRRLILLLLHRGGVSASGRATVWGTRRTVLRRRPSGPWVVQPASEQAFVAAGWTRRSWRQTRKNPRTVESGGGAEPPPLEAADLYLYAHGNGAIFLYRPDARSRFVVLSEALEVARDCGSAGGRVFLGGDAGERMADHVLASIRRTGTPVVDYVPLVKPYRWDAGGDALMLAAGYGQDDLLDDLLDRGADVRATNHSGSTALHHAAGAGNLHAIDRLLAAGADPDARNDIGLTPHMQAMAARAHPAALRLEAAGATPAHADNTQASFRPIHWLPPIGHIVVILVWACFGVVLAWPPTLPARLIGAMIGGGVAVLLLAPTRALWTGAVPRRLEGPRLHLCTFLGRQVVVDLDTVTAAACGISGGRWGRIAGTRVVLVHPGGLPYRRRSLQRKALLGPKEAELLAEEGRATVMILDPRWQHDVLRPVGNRLITGPATLTPLLQHYLKQARTADPGKAVNLPARRRRRRRR